MRIKQRKESLLVSLFVMDCLEGKAIYFDEEVAAILDLPLNQKTRSTLVKLVKAGILEEAGENSFKLSTKGLEELAIDYPYVRSLYQPWDGFWRILSYEIPESQRELRDKLRRRVSAWGLGPWHRSFWITPHPIIDPLKQLISGKREQQYVQAFEARHVFGDLAVLVEKTWSISTLEKKYRDLFKQWHRILSQEQSSQQKLMQIISGYVDVIKIDPGLPKQILGEQWVGYEAIGIFKEIKSILLPHK